MKGYRLYTPTQPSFHFPAARGGHALDGRRSGFISLVAGLVNL
jgi:hypothetical protein